MTTRPADSAGQVPPNDLGAEAAVLSAVMLDPNVIALVVWLRPDEFYSEPNRRVFEAARAVAEAGQTVNVVSVAGRLRDTNRLEQVGGTAYLADLVDKLPSVANVEEFAQRIRDKARLRSLIRKCDQTKALAYDSAGSAQKLLAEHEQAIFDLSLDDRGRKGEMVGPIIQNVLGDVGRAAQAGRDILGIPTGLERLDALTAGLHDHQLTIVAARPGMGKTGLGWCIAKNIAQLPPDEDGWASGVAFFSLEMPRADLVMRAACEAARVSSDSLRRPRFLQDRDWNALANAAHELYNLPVFIDDTPHLGLIELSGTCRRVAAEWGPKKIKLRTVFIDYLQLMRGSGSSREQEIASISRGLKGAAKELHLPVVALAQLNRGVESRGVKDKRPQLSDLRESGAIEQDADNIIFIYRDEYYNPKSEHKGLAELIVAKQRMGPPGKVFVRFNAQYVQFSNLAYGEGPKEDEAA